MQHMKPDRRPTHRPARAAVAECGALLATVVLLFFLFPGEKEADAQEGAPTGVERYLLARHGADAPIHALARDRLQRDLEVLQGFRPAYAFWQHVFAVPDGSVVYGSRSDGRLLAVFPARGNWLDRARWEDESLAFALEGRRLATNAVERRREVADILGGADGPALHNATRGQFVIRNVPRYGGFLDEWGRIFERFGVPAEIGLSQVLIESGLNGTIRSEAGAMGLCQWMPRNWSRLNQLSPHVLEGHNQTTQAPYCAAYLTILATRYGSFIPALSEHHAGGTNVGRTIINGSRLGGETAREQYLLGSDFARELRGDRASRFRPLVRTYGPRSALYAEMVFGNAANVARLRGEVPQETVHAMRAERPIPLAEVTRRTGLSVDEVRRYNPALIRQVPRGATLYLPMQVDDFGRDVAFWHWPADPDYAAVLADFLELEATVEEWENPAFGVVLGEYVRRFAETGTEEGDVMAAALTYAMEDAYTSRRAEILAEFRTDPAILRLVLEGIGARADATPTVPTTPVAR
jgi:hypothetical protein